MKTASSSGFVKKPTGAWVVIDAELIANLH